MAHRLRCAFRAQRIGRDGARARKTRTRREGSAYHSRVLSASRTNVVRLTTPPISANIQPSPLSLSRPASAHSVIGGVGASSARPYRYIGCRQGALAVPGKQSSTPLVPRQCRRDSPVSMDAATPRGSGFEGAQRVRCLLKQSTSSCFTSTLETEHSSIQCILFAVENKIP
jgi:hypothetical protein